MRNISQLPYHVEYTGSLLITKVKQHWAWLVPGWETTWEYQVQLFLWWKSLIEILFLIDLHCDCDLHWNHWINAILDHQQHTSTKAECGIFRLFLEKLIVVKYLMKCFSRPLTRLSAKTEFNFHFDLHQNLLDEICEFFLGNSFICAKLVPNLCILLIHRTAMLRFHFSTCRGACNGLN